MKKLLLKYIPAPAVVPVTTHPYAIHSMAKIEKQRVTLYLNQHLLKHAKAQAIVEESSLTALVEKALTKYLPKETILRKTNTPFN